MPPMVIHLNRMGIRGECYRISGLTCLPECSAFGMRMMMDGVATAHSSCSVFPDSGSPYNSQTWHCLCIQVTFREGQRLNPPPEYAWMGSIVTDMQD